MVTRGQRLSNRKVSSGTPSAEKKEWLPAETVQCWFNDFLQKDDPRLSLDVCRSLAREFRIIFNRHNNAELERRGPAPFESLKDVSPAAELDKRVQKVRAAADQLLVVAYELKNFAGGYQWSGAVSLEDIIGILERIGAVPFAQDDPSPRPPRGRPRETWHAAAREFAHKIKKVLEAAKYGGRLRMADEESVVAYVGAKAANWAYRTNIDAAGFASAMRVRDRKKRDSAKSFSKRYPGAALIKVGKGP
jgi:hypothetical protein